MAFKNVSDVAFDSIQLRLTITDMNGNAHVFNMYNGQAKMAPLPGNDSVIISYDIPVQSYPGENQLELEVNPDGDQAEQFHFNNYLYSPFYVIVPYCPGAVTAFTAYATGNANTYQWQVNTGAGFTNITNNSLYTGTTTDSLTLIDPPSSMYGYTYRCVISDSTSILYSSEYVLKFTDIWTGSIDTTWEKGANWDCGLIPDANMDVLINTGLTNYPVIKSNAICRSIHMNSSAALKVTTGYSLNIAGPPASNGQ